MEVIPCHRSASFYPALIGARTANRMGLGCVGASALASPQALRAQVNFSDREGGSVLEPNARQHSCCTEGLLSEEYPKGPELSHNHNPPTHLCHYSPIRCTLQSFLPFSRISRINYLSSAVSLQPSASLRHLPRAHTRASKSADNRGLPPHGVAARSLQFHFLGTVKT